MLELIENKPVIDVQESEFRRLLGYPPDYEPESRSQELAAAARDWYAEHGKPWFYLREVSLVLADRHFALDGAEFDLSRLHKQLSTTGAHSAFVAVVSAGPELEDQARRLWEEGKPDEYFFLEVYGSAVVEHLTALAANSMCGWADENSMVALPHYSPGYSGWNIADQNRLHDAIIRKQQTAFPGPLAVLDSGMLTPKKSQIAVFGITRHLDRVDGTSRYIPCENCLLRSCAYRRAPYKSPIRRPRDLPLAGSSNVGRQSAAVADEAYSISARTLRKWAKERLRITVHEDDSIEASFRYDGSTCSNLGRPLSYDYHIKLSPASDGHFVREAWCEPSPDDDGHKFMCAYLKAPDTFLDLVANEHPMVGRRLGDTLSWNPDARPTGCYCDERSRIHKWRNVFEVLHFALIRILNSPTSNGSVNIEFE